jgi:flagellar assembly protein FliH
MTPPLQLLVPPPAPAPASGPILSNVMLHPVPRALGRRGGAASDGPTIASAGPRTSEQGYHDGHSQGHAQGLQQGHHEGSEIGRREGHERGLAEARAEVARELQRRIEAAQGELEQKLQRIDALAASLSAQFSEQLAARLRDAEGEMVALAHAATCRLLGEHALRDEHIVGAVRHAIESHLGGGSEGSADGLLVRVHPHDLDLLRGDTTLASWLERQGVHGLRWQADPELGSGGCVVRGALDSLDARLDTQLDALQREFARYRAQQAPQRAPDATASTHRTEPLA